jgi:hypothetical protein
MNRSKGLGTRVYEAIDRVAHQLPSPLLRMFSMPVSYQANTSDVFAYESARMVSTAMSIVKNNQCDGDYAEFGVFHGRTFIEAVRAAERCELNEMRFWAFDSFEGLPEVKGVDEGGEFETGQFAFGRDEFIKNLARYRVDLDKVEIVEGFYEKTLVAESPVPPRSIAVAWIDCDLYESTVPVLEFLTERLVDGAILIFDDWYCFKGRPDRGEQRACGEWLQNHPDIHLTEYRRFHWAGNSFIFNRNVPKSQ